MTKMKKSRMTNQRAKILEYLRSVNTHPTAEIIYQEVKKHLPNITLATVYRNLKKLEELEKVLKIDVNGVYHFDADTCQHQHCICQKCGKITDLHKEEISKQAIKKAKSKDFEPVCACIIIQGHCKKRNNKGKSKEVNENGKNKHNRRKNF